jgi:hypothetical protein
MNLPHCVWCEEPLQPGDRVYHYANDARAHQVCMLRQVLGSVAHIEERCGCFLPGANETDPPGLSRRQAAEAAVQVWRARQ